MRTLVTAASRHGSTAEIARTIGEVLEEGGSTSWWLPPEEVDTLEGYEAVVLGSAVYPGHWLKPATEFVERFAETLPGLRIWLFSSGPIGDPPKPEEDPVDVAELMEATGAADHRVFPGRLAKSELSFGEKAIVLPSGPRRGTSAIGMRSGAGRSRSPMC